MDVDVEYVLNGIFKSLLREEEKLKLSNNEKSKDEDDTFCHTHEKLQNQVPSRNEICEVPVLYAPKLSYNYEGTDSSSGFEDLSPSKARGNISDTEDCHVKNASIKKLESIVNYNDCILSHSTGDIDDRKFEGMATSTPKSQTDTSEGSIQCHDLSTDPNHNEKEWDELSEREENDDYLDMTIEDAINKYEAEEKFKEVSVQTNFQDVCTCYSSPKPCRATTETIHPPVKKAKFENHSMEASSNRNDNFELSNSEFLKAEEKPLRFGPITYFVNKFPFKATKAIISDGASSTELTKIPRIRVGLSKRARLHFKN